MVNIEELERQLIGAWVSGDNQEDIQQFSRFIFYENLFEVLKKMPLHEIGIINLSAKCNVSKTEIAKMVTEYFPSMYQESYKSLKMEKVKAMIQNIVKNPKDVESQIEVITNEIDIMNQSGIKPPSDMVKDYRKEIERRKEAKLLKYGLTRLDKLTGGIRPQELTVIAARPSIGKTALALQVAFQLAIEKHHILFFPLEMSSAQLMERIACRETDIDHDKLKAPKNLTERDAEILDNFLNLHEEITSPYMHIIEGVSTLSEIKRHILHYKPECVFIDQLSKLRENRRFNSLREQFTYMTTNLKHFTMDYNIPIILMAQINRELQGNTVPTLNMLKESGSIEEDADNVIMLHQTEEAFNDGIPSEIIIRKQRNGERDATILATYRCKRFLFMEEGRQL